MSDNEKFRKFGEMVFGMITDLQLHGGTGCHQGCWNLPAEWCDGCDGCGWMEGWNRRDGSPCPICHGNAIVLERSAPVTPQSSAEQNSGERPSDIGSLKSGKSLVGMTIPERLF